jgi:hypothetical protein
MARLVKWKAKASIDVNFCCVNTKLPQVLKELSEQLKLGSETGRIKL